MLYQLNLLLLCAMISGTAASCNATFDGSLYIYDVIPGTNCTMYTVIMGNRIEKRSCNADGMRGLPPSFYASPEDMLLDSNSRCSLSLVLGAEKFGDGQLADVQTRGRGVEKANNKAKGVRQEETRKGRASAIDTSGWYTASSDQIYVFSLEQCACISESLATCSD